MTRARLVGGVLLCLVFGGVMTLTLRSIAASPVGDSLPDTVLGTIAESGVEHPLTAVLLNFRSYDTLLEIGVLVIAAIAGLSLANPSALEDPELRTHDVLLGALQRWFVPVMWLMAGYLVWAGAHQPGGAFQAGAVLAATGVLMRLGGMPIDFLRPNWLLRAGLVMGFAVFLVVAVMAAVVGEAFLAYPPGMEKSLILLIEVSLTLSIAMVLLSLFVAGPVHKGPGPRESDR